MIQRHWVTFMFKLGEEWFWLDSGIDRSCVPLHLRWIEAGEFLMGSPQGEPGRSSDERQHRARISSGFWIGTHLVTQAQYAWMIGTNPSQFTSDCNNPVECVTWNDAVLFCDRLTVALQSRIPQSYRFSLPTETQWEYCCRAGTTTPYYYGESLESLDRVAWYAANSAGETHPVGQKIPNPWGLYDIQGNVCEWCLDKYSDYPMGSVSDRIGRNSDAPVVFRSGSWGASERRVFRSAHRGYCDPRIMRPFFGFRVCLHSIF